MASQLIGLKKALIVSAVVFAVTRYLIPKPSLDALKSYSGTIVAVQPKSNGNGVYIRLATRNGDEVLLNVGVSTEEKNKKIERLSTGDPINAWVDDSFPLFHNSLETWQLQYGQEMLVVYETKYKGDVPPSSVALRLGVRLLV